MSTFTLGSPGHLNEHNRLAAAFELVTRHGAVGDGSTDDSTAIQAALDAIPASGGVVAFPPGVYRIGTKLTADQRGLVVMGFGGSSYNEDVSGANGVTLLGDAGVTIFEFSNAGGLVHSGPRIQGINFREASEGKTSTLLSIKNANRWGVVECTFRGGAVGFSLDADGGDVSWGRADRNTFVLCTVGFDIPNGCGTSSIIGQEFTGCTTGMRLMPSSYLTGEISMFACKFDGGTTGLHTKAQTLRLYGSGFEQCVTGVLIERDAALHNNSGEANMISGCDFNGVSMTTGVSIGSGCVDTLLVGNWFEADVGTLIDDSGTRTTTIQADKLGFFGAAPTAQQTGVAVSAAAIHAALVNLGLITA